MSENASSSAAKPLCKWPPVDEDASEEEKRLDLRSLAMSQMKEMLKKEGLSVTGKRWDLVKRICDHNEKNTGQMWNLLQQGSDHMRKKKKKRNRNRGRIGGGSKRKRSEEEKEEEEDDDDDDEDASEEEKRLDLRSLTVSQMKEMLKKEGLSVTGKRWDLVKRIYDHNEKNTGQTWNLLQQGSDHMRKKKKKARKR